MSVLETNPLTTEKFIRKCGSQNKFFKTKKELNMVTKKNDFIATFFIIFGIFALNACATVRYESRPALEPLPVTGPVPIAEVEAIAEVEVDDETGDVNVTYMAAAHDCGTAINPMLVEGQIQGGISMGIGFALQEEMLFDEKGVQINPNLTNYIMPTSLDMPDIDVDIVENFDPTGPFGAKGVGEPTAVPTAAAICNAIYDAVGVRVTSLPATAEKVLALIKEKNEKDIKQLSPAE